MMRNRTLWTTSRFFAVLCWWLLVDAVYAQSDELEVMQQIESSMFDDLNTASQRLNDIKNNSAILGSDSLKSYYFNLLALQKIIENDLAQAVKNIETARGLAVASNNRYQEAESYRREGLIYSILQQYSDALVMLTRSFQIHNELNSPRVMDSIEFILNIYVAVEQYETLEEYSWLLLENALTLDNTDKVAAAHHHLGLSFLGRHDYERAGYHFTQEKEANAKLPTPFSLYNDYGFAKLAFAQGDYALALNHVEEAKKFIAARKFNLALPEVLSVESDIRAQMGQTGLAIQLLNHAISVAKEVRGTSQHISLLQQLAKLYKDSSDFENAVHTLEQANALEAENKQRQRQHLLAINQAKLDLETKKRQINQLKVSQELSQQRQRVQALMLVFASVVIVLLVVFSLRINKQKKSLRQLTQALQRATEAKSDFLARMSHEIRTPINAIIGLTKLSLRGSENEHQATNLKQIEESSQLLLGVINDVLDFSKIEAGKLLLESRPFSIDEVIDKAIRLTAIKAREKDIELVKFISRDVPTQVEGDAFRLQQVLNNLLSNAVKFTDSGSVSVVVNRAHNDTHKRDEDKDGHVLIRFEVKDTGKGLTTDQKNKLFDSFTQEDESITRQYGGTGLGLAICRQLVELMGGRIWVESVPSQGATFYFTVKLKVYPQKLSPQAEEPSLSTLRVLLVDDSPLSQQVMADLLLSMGITPQLVSDGQACIKELRRAEQQTPYDLILLDWKMPEVDGIEVASIIRHSSLKNQPNIVMISSYELSTLKALGEPLGINGFLGKPLSKDALLACIRQLKGLRRTIDTTLRQSQLSFNGHHKKILLVEDNVLNQKVALGYLKDTHAEVIVADNGQVALDLLRQHNDIDVVLMDIQMPIMDGLTATRHIREGLGSHVPIIAMTAHAMAGDQDKSLAAGMNAHIVKPIDPVMLFTTLNEVVNGKRRVDNPPVAPYAKTEANADIQSLLIIDKAQAIRTMHDNLELYQELVADFTSLEPNINQLKVALLARDTDSLRSIIHAMQPPLSYIGAYSLAQFANGLEMQLQRTTSTLPNECLCQLDQFIEALSVVTQQVKQHH